MKTLVEKINKVKFAENILEELSKLPFGSLPKSELELILLHSIIESNGGYDNINRIEFQSALKLTQTKFKNKILEAQLRFDKTNIKVEEYLKKNIIEKDIDELIIEDKYLILYISNPLLLDNLKTYLDFKQIINDTSFNKNILKIENKGLLKILVDLLEKKQLKKIEEKFKEDKSLKNLNFSLVNKLHIDSIFSVSVDPLESMKTFIEFIRKALN